jgi:hypothetical protein
MMLIFLFLFLKNLKYQNIDMVYNTPGLGLGLIYFIDPSEGRSKTCADRVVDVLYPRIWNDLPKNLSIAKFLMIFCRI